MNFKVPSELYSKASQQNKLGQVVFFLQCKMLFPTHGQLEVSKFSKTMSCAASKSKSYSLVSKLIQSGMMVKKNGYYSLINFDSFCKKLGIDPDTTKIHRIPSRLVPLKRLKEYLATIEIKDNLKAQTAAAYKKLSKDHRIQYNEPKTRSSKRSLGKMNDAIKDSFQAISTVQVVHDNQEAFKDAEIISHYDQTVVNPDVTLSCLGAGNLLNMSKSSAWNLLEKLRKLGWIDWSRRFLIYKPFTLLEDEHGYDTTKYYLKDGTLFYKIPNSLSVCNWQEIAYSL